MGNKKDGEPVSNNARKYYRKLAKLHSQIAKVREDYLQKLTTELALKYQHIKVETLNIRGMMANRKLGFHIADASFYRFKTLLSQKVLASGGVIESIDMWYPSSKLCSRCQRKNSDLTLKDRLYVCQCGLNICRDRNSAIHLKQAPEDKITNGVGSIRIEQGSSANLVRHEQVLLNACGHETAYGHGLKQEENIIVQLSLFDLSNYG